MADIAAGDVTYTLLNQRKMSDSRNMNRVRLAFGDAALTVPAAGIPLTKGKLGCPTVIESLIVVDKGTSGYSFVYDQSAGALLVYGLAAHAHSLFIRDNTVADAAATRLNVGANALSANTGSNVTIAGNTATGGVLNSAAGAGGVVSTDAIAATTIEVEVIGW